jgi:hypothetical protein
VPNFRRLSSDPDFEALFTEGPLADEIRKLEDEVRSLSQRDPVEVMRAKAMLAGILKVRECVNFQADAEAKAAQARLRAQASAKKPRRWAEMLLPHRLG